MRSRLNGLNALLPLGTEENPGNRCEKSSRIFRRREPAREISKAAQAHEWFLWTEAAGRARHSVRAARRVGSQLRRGVTRPTGMQKTGPDEDRLVENQEMRAVGFAEADWRSNPIGDGSIRDGPGARVIVAEYQRRRTVGVGDH